MTELKDLLRDDAVALDLKASNWRDAIRAAGALLERVGSATAEYTEAMVQSVEKNGPYIVVSPGFAFAHARPSEAVKETALSWVRLKEPVKFGHSRNDPVSLVVALAARDSRSHTAAMKELATLLADAEKRAHLATVSSACELKAVLTEGLQSKHVRAAQSTSSLKPASKGVEEETVTSKGKILTVCGNGLGTSLFLKNTLEEVLDRWGWTDYVTVEATDTISAKGRAKEADFLLTSREIAATLGDVGVPVKVIEDFTSEIEIDGALRALYAV